MKNNYRVNGNFAYIELNSKKHGDQEVIIDLNLLNKAKEFQGKWYVYSSKRSKSFYAKGNILKPDGGKTTIFLHKFLLESPPDEIVDHIDGNGLNNVLTNLRTCNSKQNAENHTSLNTNNSTGFRGVTYDKKKNKYLAYIHHNYKKIHLGMFQSAETANKMSTIARAMIMTFATDIDEKYKYFKEFDDDRNRLIFRYGSMSSGKSELLLFTNTIYKKLGYKPLLLSSVINTRDEVGQIKSRNGMSAVSTPASSDVDLFLTVKDKIKQSNYDIVLVDEIHFFSRDQILQLGRVVDELNVNVICYGLMVDFKGNLFNSVETLVTLSDDIQQINHKCECGGNAIMNLRMSNGKPVFNGKTFIVGAEERYKSICRKCYSELKQNEIQTAL